MFVISELEDGFALAPQKGAYNKDILKQINKRYIKTHTNELGLGITLSKDVEVVELKLVQDFVFATVRFEMLFFRFVRDELLFGAIVEQSTDGVQLSAELYDKILVEPAFLPEENEPTTILDKNNNKKFAWVWKYKGNRLVIKNGETARMKILYFNDNTKRLHCTFRDPGLGPISWWQ